MSKEICPMARLRPPSVNQPRLGPEMASRQLESECPSWNQMCTRKYCWLDCSGRKQNGPRDQLLNRAARFRQTAILGPDSERLSWHSARRLKCCRHCYSKREETCQKGRKRR